MKKVLLFLLISLVPCIGYAESGNISISGKTYTYSTAKTKFVDPFIKKITVQKTTQAKERFKKLYVKQLETKKKLAEKKNDTNLSVFYADMILQISQVSTQGIDYAVPLKYNTEADFQKAITNLNTLWTCDFPGEEYKKHKSIFTGITCTMDDVLKERVGIVTALFNGQGTSQETRNNTTTAVIAKYGKDSVEYNYYMAHIDAFAPVQTINNNVNNGGIGGSVNDSSVIVSSLSQAENKKVLVQREIISVYNSEDGKNQSRSRFIDFIIEQYAKDSYAVDYAKILPFNQQ